MSSLCLVGPDVFTDLELFTSFSNDVTQTVMYIFKQYACNDGCIPFITNKLKKPIYNVEDLYGRQHTLKSILMSYEENTEYVDTILSNIKLYEKDVQWLFNSKASQEGRSVQTVELDSSDDDKSIVDVMDIVFFKLRFLQCLNKCSSLLFLKNMYTIVGAPILGFLSPLLYFIIPYMVLVYKLKFKINIVTFVKVITKSLFQNHNLRKLLVIQLVTYCVSFFFYCQSLLNTIELAKNTYNVSHHIIQKIKNVIAYISECDKLKVLFNLSYHSHIDESVPHIDISQKDFLNYGSFLVYYKNIDTTALKTYLENINSFLADLTFVKIFSYNDMCFATYNTENQSTFIKTENMYHLSIQKYVPNNLLLDTNNCIITGPNAAGKSTFIKGLVLNVLLSQTYGIANASFFELTPFYLINTQINIPDTKGKESLFEAEMFRCKQNIDIIKYLPKHYKGFIVMDEVFSSTNVVEGVAGAYGILQKMSSYPNICTVVTTHLLYLTKLPSFKKYKMNVAFSKNGTITYPYIITLGYSKQLIALELIKNNFDDDVIDTAISIKNKLLV
jgi:hypothetical protein